MDVVKGYFFGPIYTDGTKSLAVYIPPEIRKSFNIRPPLKPKFNVFLDKEKKRIIFELQEFVKEEE